MAGFFGRGGIDFSGADPMHQLDRGSRVIDSESTASDRFFIDARVKIAEAVGELDLFAIDDDRTECADLARFGFERKIAGIHRQEPSHTRALKLDESCHLLAACL